MAILVAPEQTVKEDLRSGLLLADGKERWIRVGMSDTMYGFEAWWEGAEKAEWLREITII